MHRTSRNAGFTVVELLVVIAIIGLLLALLLPAVQSAREAARRIECQNNLKQLGLAAFMYEQSFQAFPNACLFPPNHGWGTFILPFVDQQAVHDIYRFDRNFDDPLNFAATNVAIRTFICPSAPNRTGGAYPAGVCDYAPIYNVDPTAISLGVISPRPNPDGILYCNARLRRADVLDGTSHTLLLVEDAGRPVLLRRGKIAGQTEVAGWATFNNVTPINLDGFSSDGAQMFGPCAINCTNLHECYSLHPTGANVVFVDGHVQFLSETIRIDRMADLVTRANGEPVGDEP
jgi:prepilin-type N-terminal cleavage/methylation domain-containing protein/prepilin-type processing-associated H-X9-DG protein